MSNISNAEDTIKVAEGELNSALDTLQTEGSAALEKARQRAKEFGQQSDKMTNIAHEARQIADDLDVYSDKITQAAVEAKNKSIEAYELAKNATDQQRNVSQDIRLLRNEIGSTALKLNRVKNWTEEVHDKATKAKNKALALLNEVTNLVIPDIDIPKLKHDVDATKEEARQLINDTMKLLEKNDKLLGDVDEQILAAEDLLARGYEQQDIANDFLSEIDLAKSQAEKAVALGQEILDEAKATYETLSRKYTYLSTINQ